MAFSPINCLIFGGSKVTRNPHVVSVCPKARNPHMVSDCQPSNPPGPEPAGTNTHYPRTQHQRRDNFKLGESVKHSVATWGIRTRVRIDLDDTLYPLKTGIAPAVKKNIDDFLMEKFGFSESKASSLRVELFKSYGSTLAGLRALGHDVHPDEYHSVVHGRLPYGSIQPNSKLRNLLNKIKQKKIIFTNSDRNHAMKVLERLGLEDCFEEIICFETMNPNLFGATTRPDEHPVVLKPSLTAMDVCIRAANVDPRRAVFLDDNVHNITAGKSVGLRTVLVGRSEKTKDADYAVETVTEIATAVPDIWETATAGCDDGGERISRSKSELEGMASITAVGA